jgi:tripartite-type tricarboxylate transporter receptor subunit TctC
MESSKARKKGMVLFVCAFFALLLPNLSFGQEYPTKPVTMIVPFPAGGVLDVSSRILANRAEKALGQPFIVNNVAGGGGSVAVGVAAKEKPDGYHIVSCVTTQLIRIPQLRAVPYTMQDFTPILHFGQPQTGTFVKGDAPWKTFKELVEYARQNPGKVTYSTSGVGSPMHMVMEFIGKQEKIQWTHVPYPGGAPALAAVLGGHVTAMSDAEGFPSAAEGSLRLLASHGEKQRTKGFPNVPTVRELGYDIFNEATFLVVTQKGTPQPIIKKLDDAFKKAMADPEFVQTLEKIEIKPAYRNSEDTKKYLEELYPKIGKMIKDFNIPVEK